MLPVPVDTKGLAEPAVKLLDMIRGFVWGVAEPYQMKRLAHAEVEVAKIKAAGSVAAVVEALDRATIRRDTEDVREQQNLEDVVRRALPSVSSVAKPESLGTDWLVNFFNKAKMTSDEAMKHLWAKILAGEANSPGAFSKRTVNLVAELDKQDAENFTKVASFVLEGTEPFLLIFNWTHEIYRYAGITHNMLMRMQDAGLLDSESWNPYGIDSVDGKLDFRYFDKLIRFTRSAATRQSRFSYSVFHLTTSGRQLFPVCGPVECPGFLEYLVDVLKKQPRDEWSAAVLP